MRKIIAAINTTLDGFCDHTAGLPDEEIHKHYEQLLVDSGAILYGRITFELMKFWQDLVKNPSGEKSMDDFASAMDQVPKIVFSNTLETTDWESATLSKKSPGETVLELRQQKGKDILIGSRSLIVQLTNLDLIDEYQICVHPVIIGEGLPLFEKLHERTVLDLQKTRTLKSGAIILYYKRAKHQPTIH
ncbi:MAG: dihydrofolate reductase [Flavobacterium sp.]|uniref:dihydrofolate reductase family protein n=1 Tax=Flavobacterium sp. TaxID=239 RepID=UPI00120B876C|nr:dihydrofolate reductase family protein [Flavobacterium sp.]RZJ68434.1 MAG: dihydrofolate reductase [Flavobacterium sp.]